MMDPSNTAQNNDNQDTTTPVPDLSSLMDPQTTSAAPSSPSESVQSLSSEPKVEPEIIPEVTEPPSQHDAQITDALLTGSPLPPEVPTTDSMQPATIPPPPKKKSRKKTLIMLLLFFLISLPIIGFYVQSRQQVGDTRNRAEVYAPTGACGSTGQTICTSNQVLYVCVNSGWQIAGSCTAPSPTGTNTPCLAGTTCTAGSSCPGNRSEGQCVTNGLPGLCCAPAQCIANFCMSEGGTGCFASMGMVPITTAQGGHCGSWSECVCGGGGIPTPTPTPGTSPICGGTCIPSFGSCAIGFHTTSDPGCNTAALPIACCRNNITPGVTPFQTCPSGSSCINAENCGSLGQYSQRTGTCVVNSTTVGACCTPNVCGADFCMQDYAGTYCAPPMHTVAVSATQCPTTSTLCTCGNPGPTSTPIPSPTPFPTFPPNPTSPPNNPTNTPVPPPSATPIVGQCLNVKVYRNNVVVNPNTLQPGNAIVIAVAGTNATQARISINGGAFITTTTVNTAGEYTLPYTIPASGVTSFTIQAELLIGGVWK